MMRRLDGFARDLVQTEATVRRIVEKVAIDMPAHAAEARLAQARLQMIVASS